MRWFALLLAMALGSVFASAVAAPDLSKALQTSWPDGTRFALVDATGQVVWEPGTPLTSEALAQAKQLEVTLPDGTSYLIDVQVEGKGAGLGEVKVVVDGKTVPLPELLHAKGFTVQDGTIVKEKPKKGRGEQGQDEESTSEDQGNGKSGGGGSSEDHGQGSGQRGHRP
jgi:uncharacterized membrane protein YgcG